MDAISVKFIGDIRMHSVKRLPLIVRRRERELDIRRTRNVTTHFPKRFSLRYKWRLENIQIKSHFLPHVRSAAHVKIPCATEMINQNAELEKCTFFDLFFSPSSSNSIRRPPTVKSSARAFFDRIRYVFIFFLLLVCVYVVACISEPIACDFLLAALWRPLAQLTPAFHNHSEQ